MGNNVKVTQLENKYTQLDKSIAIMQKDISSLLRSSENTQKDIKSILDNINSIDLIKSIAEENKKEIKKINELLRNYESVKNLVFGAVGFILFAVLGAVVSLTLVSA